jgi:hypothetical protein
MSHEVAADANNDSLNVSVSVLYHGFELFANGSSPNTLVDMVA